MIAVAPALVALLMLFGGSGTSAGRGQASTTLTVMGPWTGPDAKSFGAVLQAFDVATPRIHVHYVPEGVNLIPVLKASRRSAQAPDLAVVPSAPLFVATWVRRGFLAPQTF